MKIKLIIFLFLPILTLGQGKRIFTPDEWRKAEWFINDFGDTTISYLLIDKKEVINDTSFYIQEDIHIGVDSLTKDWTRRKWIETDYGEQLHGEQKHYNQFSFLKQITYYKYGQQLEMWKSFEYYDNEKVFRYGQNYKDTSNYITYHSNGNRWITSKYKNGRLWNIEDYFDVNGKKLKIGTLKNGTGTFHCYDKKGKTKGIHIYKKGRQIKKKSTCVSKCN